MATFNQGNQTVFGNQQNAETIYNSDNVTQNREDIIQVLEKFKIDLSGAKLEGSLPAQTAKVIEQEVSQAIEQVKKDNPDKKTVLEHLKSAKSYMDGITSASKFVETCEKIVQLIQQWF